MGQQHRMCPGTGGDGREKPPGSHSRGQLVPLAVRRKGRKGRQVRGGFQMLEPL